jgi:glycosyltransferase involved in cell wall biosynthesis
MKAKNIAIITYDWPPRNSIATHRPYSWAKYWAEQGIKVTVVTASKQNFDQPLDLFLPELPVSVIEIPFKNLNLVLSPLIRITWIRLVLRYFKTLLEKNLKIIIDPRSGWFVAAKPYLYQIAKDVDIVVSTYGPESAHLIAAYMKKINPKLKWIADYRDLWSHGYMHNISDRFRQLMRKKEISSVGRYANKITVVSQDMVVKLSHFFKKPVLQIANGFDIDENEVKRRALAKRSKGTLKQPLHIVYTGTIYSGFRDPKPLFDAIAYLIKSNQITSEAVSVNFYGERLEAVNQFAKDVKYKKFIRLMGHVKHELALDAQRNARALLLLESIHPESSGNLTGKIFEYIAAGKPILCIGSRPEYEIGRVLKKTGTGIVISPDETKKLQEILLQLIKNSSNMKWYKPNINEILKYSRRTKALQFLKEIKKK